MTFVDGPEAEFVRGDIVERSLPDYTHSAIQTFLGALFVNLRDKYPLFPASELRVRIKPDLYRVIDVAVFTGQRPPERVSQPPAIAIEIVSLHDRYTEVLQKLEEYRTWGVAHIWLVDPQLQKLHVYQETGLTQVAAFALPEYGFQITMEEILKGI